MEVREEDVFVGNRNTHYDAHLGSAEMPTVGETERGGVGGGECWG